MSHLLQIRFHTITKVMLHYHSQGKRSLAEKLLSEIITDHLANDDDIKVQENNLHIQGFFYALRSTSISQPIKFFLCIHYK